MQYAVESNISRQPSPAPKDVCDVCFAELLSLREHCKRLAICYVLRPLVPSDFRAPHLPPRRLFSSDTFRCGCITDSVTCSSAPLKRNHDRCLLPQLRSQPRSSRYFRITDVPTVLSKAIKDTSFQSSFHLDNRPATTELLALKRFTAFDQRNYSTILETHPCR